MTNTAETCKSRYSGFVRIVAREGNRSKSTPANDLVDRNFDADKPNILWVADITYVPTWTDFLHLALALDAFSRRIFSWAIGNTLKAQLVLDALNMALRQRKPDKVIHHSDQGSQYTSIAFGLRCKEAGVRPSMGSVGDGYVNAMYESFFATLEYKLLDRRKFKTQGRGPHGHLRVHRRMVQSRPAPSGTRLSIPHQLRKERP